MSLWKKHKVVIDTNVFVSGILFGGKAEKILRLFKKSKIELFISPQTAHELFRKLEKFEVEEETISDLHYIINLKAIKVLPREKVKISRDPKDNMFLEVSLEGKVDYLITGDKDLLILKKFRGTLIISPKEFLDIHQ